MRFQNINKQMIKFFGEVFLMTFLVSVLHADDGLQGLTIAEALDTALSKNPNIKAVRAQRDATEARVWEAKSGFFPRLSVSSGI